MLLFYILSAMSTFAGLTPFTSDPRRCCGITPAIDESSTDSCDISMPLRNCCKKQPRRITKVPYQVLPTPCSCKFTTRNLQKHGCDKEHCHSQLLRHCTLLSSNIQVCKWPGTDSRRKFVDMMVNFLCCYKTNRPNLVQILYIIYDNFSDFDDMLMFLANSIHNTYGFRFLVNECGMDRYRSRGLLQITTRPNYCKLGAFYEQNPDALALFEPQPVIATIKFWKVWIRSGCFSETVKKLNPCEVEYNYEWCKELDKRLRNRYVTYACLCRYFGREPKV